MEFTFETWYTNWAEALYGCYELGPNLRANFNGLSSRRTSGFIYK